MPRRWALGAFTIVLVALALLKMGPWLRVVVRPTSSVPGPDPLAAVAPIRLEPRRSACVKDVGLDTDSRVALIVVRPVRGRAGALRVVASGPGYRAAGSTPPVAGVRAPVTAVLAPPPRSMIGRVCVVNPTQRPVVLEGSAEGRTDTRQVTEVAGKPAPGLSLQLLHGDVQRRFRETPLLLRRAAEYKAGFLRGWML